MKVPNKFQQDYKLYQSWFSYTKEQLSLVRKIQFPIENSGYSALETLYSFDTFGKKIPCREPEELNSAINGKITLNFQIQQWAEGINEGLFDIREFQTEYEWLPSWVWKAVQKQMVK